MPDISMCKNDECPSAKLCYRHEAEPCKWRQAYGSFSSELWEDGRCGYFWPIEHAPTPLAAHKAMIEAMGDKA